MRFVCFLLLSVLLGCSSSTTANDGYHRRTILLPDGANITVDVALHPTDIAKGLMFRDSLAADHGMLFVYKKPTQASYWMYQIKFPVDIIWLDQSRRIVEISPDTPPCSSKSARECPFYGGHQVAQFVVEMPGGAAKQHHLQMGDTIAFSAL